MLQNYLKLAWRNLTKSKTFGFINIFGLAAGVLCSLYIILYVQDQYSYDKHFKDAADIYRINTIWTVQDDKGDWATVTAPVAPTMKKDLPRYWTIPGSYIPSASTIIYSNIRTNPFTKKTASTLIPAFLPSSIFISIVAMRGEP